MVATDLLDFILKVSSVVWGFSLFKDNIYTSSECNTSLATSFVPTSTCAQLVSGGGHGDCSLWGSAYCLWERQALPAWHRA